MSSVKLEGASMPNSGQASGRRLCVTPGTSFLVAIGLLTDQYELGACDIKASSSSLKPKKKKKPPVKPEPTPPQTTLAPPKVDKQKKPKQKSCSSMSQSQPPPNKFYVDNFQQTQPSFTPPDEISSISPKIDLNTLPKLPRRGSSSGTFHPFVPLVNWTFSDEDFQKPKKKRKTGGVVIDLVGLDSD